MTVCMYKCDVWSTYDRPQPSCLASPGANVVKQQKCTELAMYGKQSDMLCC